MAPNIPVRIGQIGVGYWGPNLLRNCTNNERCVVCSIADLSEERRRYVREHYPQVIATSDANHLLEDPTIDAIILATPVHTHFELAVKALKAGKHILVEKPMAESVREIEYIGRLADERGLVAMVGHTFLFNSAVRYLKNLIEDGGLGQIRYIYSQRLNLGRIRSDVDALWNLAPHDISIVQYLFGDPKPVQIKCQGMSYVQDGIDDVVFLNLVYPNRLLVNIHVSWLDPLRQRQMIIVGSKKMAVFDDTAEDKIIIYDKGIDRMAIPNERMDYDNPGAFIFNHRAGEAFSPKIDYQEPLMAEINHFLDCIQDGTECLTGTEHAKRVVHILNEASPRPQKVHSSLDTEEITPSNVTVSRGLEIERSESVQAKIS